MSQLVQSITNRRVWFLLVPLLLMFASPYVVRLLNEFFQSIGGNNLPPVPGAVLAVLTVPFVLVAFLSPFVLGQSLTYLAISVIALVACLLIVLRGRVGRGARVVALLTIGCILALPVLFQKTLDFTWLEARGYTVHAVVSQQNFLDKTVDGLVALVDGKACQYDILGWSAENTLYYRADCLLGPDTFWRYDPALPAGAQQIAQVTDAIVTTPETLLFEPVYIPTDHRSPDGLWIASVWEKSSFEPENVIVVSENS
jgi:hypothetical protein